MNCLFFLGFHHSVYPNIAKFKTLLVPSISDKEFQFVVALLSAELVESKENKISNWVYHLLWAQHFNQLYVIQLKGHWWMSVLPSLSLCRFMDIVLRFSSCKSCRGTKITPVVSNGPAGYCLFILECLLPQVSRIAMQWGILVSVPAPLHFLSINPIPP